MRPDFHISPSFTPIRSYVLQAAFTVRANSRTQPRSQGLRPNGESCPTRSEVASEISLCGQWRRGKPRRWEANFSSRQPARCHIPSLQPEYGSWLFSVASEKEVGGAGR